MAELGRAANSTMLPERAFEISDEALSLGLELDCTAARPSISAAPITIPICVITYPGHHVPNARQKTLVTIPTLGNLLSVRSCPNRPPSQTILPR